jgi:hypothetical protein
MTGFYEHDNEPRLSQRLDFLLAERVSGSQGRFWSTDLVSLSLTSVYMYC